MTKSQLVNILVNGWGLEREWLYQFQTAELAEILNDFRTKTLKA